MPPRAGEWLLLGAWLGGLALFAVTVLTHDDPSPSPPGIVGCPEWAWTDSGGVTWWRCR